MALFRRATPTAIVNDTSTPTGDTPPAEPTNDAAAMEDRIVGRLMGVLQGLNPPATQNPSAPATEATTDPDADVDATELERIDRRSAKQFQQQIEPWSGVLTKALPGLIRNQVVSTLSPGQQKLYHKYSKEVDALMKNVHPAGQAEEMVHKKAINQVLGDHLDEVEELIVQSLKAEDLPPSFSWPTTSSNGSSESEVPVLDKDMQYHLQEANRNNPRRRMTEEEVAYWSETPTGLSVQQMIEWHKENQAKKTTVSK